MEIFKGIKGFENYQVSNYGNVKSLKNNIILKPSISSGYYMIALCKDGKKHDKRVHRLVAEAFIPNPHNLPCVNHKDENSLNNFVYVNQDGSVDFEKSNLEWCTHEYNSNYGTRNKRVSANKIGVFNNPLISKKVVAVKDGEAVMEFASTREAERHGFCSSAVSDCCNGKRKTHKGYQWFFKEDWLKIQATQSNDRVACGKMFI